MVSNSAVKNKLALTFVSETDRFQNLYRLVSYFRISSRKSVDTTIQQMIKFDVLSASFIFLVTLFYSFKARYKKEVYSFLIGQNLPGIANLSQKTFKDTSKYVLLSQNEPFLDEPQFYFDTNLIRHDLTNFYENQAIKLKKKEIFPQESLIFNGKTLRNSYHIKHNNYFKKNDKFIPSIYNQTKSFNKNKIKTTLYNTNLSSSYHLAFQSFAAKNFALSTIKRLEKEGTYFKFSELPLNCDFYFGVFQKKDVNPQLSGIRENIFKFPLKKNSGGFGIVATGHPLQNKIDNKNLSFCEAKTKFSEGKQLFLTKTENLNWDKLYKQNKVNAKMHFGTTKTLFEKNKKTWFCLDQNKSLQTQWFSLYKNNLSKKYSYSLRNQKSDEKLERQPFLLDKLFSIFYDVNNLPKSRALHSYITNEHSLTNLNNNERATFTFTNWWHLIFNGDFSLNSHFIIENIDFPFFQWGKSSIFVNQKQDTALRKGKIQFSSKKFGLNGKWKKRNYDNYLQLDEFPSKLSSILPSEILIDQFLTKKKHTLIENVTKTKREILDSSKRKNKSFVIKQKFVLRGSKSLLNFSELDFTKQKDLNLQNKSTTPVNLTFSRNSAIKDSNSKFEQQEKGNNSSLKKEEEALFLQKNKNSNQTKNYLNDKFSLPKIDFTEENQSKIFHLFPKSFKLRLLRNEIKAIFSCSQKNYYFMEKEEKIFNLLSTRFLTSLDDILLDNSKPLQGEDQVSQNENLDTLFKFLPQKSYSTNHKVLQSIDDKILFRKNPVKQNAEETSSLTQENGNLLHFNTELKNKENLKLKYTKKFTQLLQDFWSKKEDISRKNGSDFLTKNSIFDVLSETKNKEQKLKINFTEKIRDNWFTFFIKYLNTQPRLMSGYQFPDLNTKEINKLIKYSNYKKFLVNKTHFVNEISSFRNHFRKNKVSTFQNPMWSIFSQISKKEICQQHPIDVYLPNNSIQKFAQSKYTSLQKNLFLDKKVGSKGTVKSVIKLPQANNLIELKKPSELLSLFSSNQGKYKFDQTEKSKNIVLQNRILGLAPLSQSMSLDKENPYLKPLKFISKSLRLENNTEKQSFFVYQIPALLKIPCIWNPRLQKLQIAKTINKSKYIPPSIDFSKNLLSSTNFLTDRKQHFFAIGNQVEKEQENCFIQRPLSGNVSGLFYKKRDSNLQGKSLFKINLQNREQDKNLNLIKKDFSVLPLLSKATVKNSFTNQLSFAPIMSSLHAGSNFAFSEENSKDRLEKIDKASKILLPSSKIYKTYPKSFKSITGINFYSFFDLSAFDSLRAANVQVKNDTFLNNCPPGYETFIDFTQNSSKFDQLPLTKKIIENSKLNIKRKQLSGKCDKQINTLQLVLPFLETDTFATTWTEWLSSRYKKPAISYRFRKKVFYLPSNKKVDFFLQQKNRYHKNKWGKIEQQENRSKKGERDEDSFTSFSEQVYLPLTIKRSIHFPNRSKILPSKNLKFSFFTTKPFFLQSHNKESKLFASNLDNKILNVTTCEQNVESQNKSKEMVQVAEHFAEQNVAQGQNDLFLKNFTKQNLVLALLRLKKSSLSSANLQKNRNILSFHDVKTKFSVGKPSSCFHFLPQKKLSFLPKTIWQEQNRVDPSFWKNRKENNSYFSILDGKENSVTQIAPLSYFLSDTLQKDQMSLSYLKRLDTNCDRLDWQFDKWYPFLHKKYAYSPPSQSVLNEEFLNSFFRNKIRKRNTIYKYSGHLPILKFHYIKSKGLKDLLPKISTLQSQNVQDKVSLHFAKQNVPKRSETLSNFRKAYSLSHLQNKQSFYNLLFPKRKRIDLCWEPITARSWMIITQYCYAFFLVQSSLYVYNKHMKKVLLSFAPLLSGRGILSGIPSFGEKLQDFLGGSTIDKNVLLFEKVSKRFQDIVAIDNKLPQLSEIVWFLRNFGRTANVNKIQGVLFVGPPGTGKTLLVQAIAGEAEVPVLVLSGSSFADGRKDKKSGQLLKRVFQRARILAPSILFIDEIDTLGESRSHFAQDDRDQKNESSRIIESISQTEGKIQGKTSSLQNRKNQSVKQVGLLTQFLVEMDGLARQQKSSSFINDKITFGKPGGILVIGSTNRPKVLDPALTRPGRFDQVFYLSNPGKQKRIEILKIYTKNIGVSPSLPWDYLGDRTLGFSAADLSAIVNKSTIQAILSHTIHTIQSIEDGIESLPKLSQNQNKSHVFQENDLSTSFLFLESQQFNNENTILCKSIFTSLSKFLPSKNQAFLQKAICTKYLNLQNKYKNFNFSTHQPKSYKNYIFAPFGGMGKPKIGISFLGRLPFYQAGKIMVQRLLFQDPITLVATLSPKQELSFLNMFNESNHVKDVTNRNQLETRLISGYAGKAAETLLISGLQFYKNNKTTVTWQSTLGVEEWKLTNSLAYLMIFKYSFYSQRVIMQKENFIALSQNSNEILETGNFQVLQNLFFKEELEFSQEKHHLELLEGKNHIFNGIVENKSFLNPIIWISNLYQQYEITKIFGHIEENNWYQVYLPPLVKDEQNKEWVPLDQYYFGRENLIELVWNTSKNKSINWSDIYQLDSDLTYQGLVLYHFNKAFSLLDKNRELLDLFANLLISFRIIRRHEILKIFSYFKYYNPDFKNF